MSNGRGDALAALASRGPRLPPLPAAGRVARGPRRRPAQALPRRGLLGEAAERLRRPGGAGRDRRPRPGRPRRQPDRPHVHRRPLRRVALRRPAPGRLRQPAESERRGDGLRLRRRLRHRRRPLRAAGQQADHRGARQLPPLPGARAGAARPLPGHRRPRRLRLGRLPARRPRARGRGAAAQAPLRPRRRGRPRPLEAARLLPPQPAEHLHRQADRADDRRRLRAGAGARRLSSFGGATCRSPPAGVS